MSKKLSDNPRRGSTLEDFLREEGIYEEVEASALKKVLAWQVAQAMEDKAITRTELASRMHTSRAAVNRLLDPENLSMNLRTVVNAASALGRRLTVQLAVMDDDESPPTRKGRSSKSGPRPSAQ